MLASLRHYRLIGRNHQHNQVQAMRAGQHILNEPLVPGDIDETDANVVDGQVGEADIDRDPALLFLLEPIGVDPGQRFDQASLPVIDMPRSSYDYVLHLDTAINSTNWWSIAANHQLTRSSTRRSSLITHYLFFLYQSTVRLRPS